MKFKLDENLRNSGVETLRAAGHDVSTVADEGLLSAPDARVLEVAQSEDRCPITLDTDFANPFMHPPGGTAGIVVIRFAGRGKKKLLDQCMQRLLEGLAERDVTGRLWIVDPARIREYQSVEDDE